jgi:SAM-dependent methyltransferase
MSVEMDRLLAATRDAETRHFWFRGFARFVTPFLREAAAGRTGLHLLDAGCGTGHNLRLLSPYGTVTGIDLTRSGLRAARDGDHVRVVQASVGALPFPASAFDIVTSFDVLYMLPDAIEQAAVAEMARVLRPGGALVINVAAMPILHGHHSVLSAEIRRYTRKGLRERLEAAGFHVTRLTHTNASLFPVMLAARMMQRRGGTRAETSDIRVPPAPINAALSALLAAEAAVVRRVELPIGSSLLGLAWKT